MRGGCGRGRPPQHSAIRLTIPSERYLPANRLKAIIFSLGCATIDRISPKLLWNGSFQQA